MTLIRGPRNSRPIDAVVARRNAVLDRAMVEAHDNDEWAHITTWAEPLEQTDRNERFTKEKDEA